MFASESVSYKNTRSFSPIVLDYLEGAEKLRSFYSFAPNRQEIKDAIQQKTGQMVQRDILVNVLNDQYKNVPTHNNVQRALESLTSNNTFTICTAHQPNLFTGPLYFIYKILHVIKLAESLSKEFPQYRFVPLYYMGCEDADLQELNHTYVDGKKYEWSTNQKGAVGRMFIDKQLIALIDQLQAQIGIEENGAGFIELLKAGYKEGKQIQDATFNLVNALFQRFGLIVLLSDDARLKAQMISIFEQDLFEGTASAIVEKTSNSLAEVYNVQAYPREINLFYLKEDIRERIEKKGSQFYIHNTPLSFTAEEMRNELYNHPERFSPNVILRGLFQETILPNIAFIGGGGELAYWLQLKDLFEHCKVVFPVLVLRNSFLIIDKRWKQLAEKLNLATGQLFNTELYLLNSIIEQEGAKPQLNGAAEKLSVLYEDLKQMVAKVDPTLKQHIEALKVGSVKELKELERKMQRAERKKRGDTKAQITKLKNALFPKSGLQERTENLAFFYSKWGSSFIDELYIHSSTLEQEFVVLKKDL